ncbi:MAG: hypothetical protein NTV94_08360 [Planctomycetota bacterium]|nr:hypothetical protein [Planctomycetota bacterium]
MNCMHAAGILALNLCVGLANGQACTRIGAFQPGSPAFHTGNGVGGFAIQGNTLIIDADKDGIVSASDPGDKVFPLPASLIGTGQNAPLNVALSPTQDFLFSAGGQASLTTGPCSSPGTRVRFFRIPVAAGAPLELVVDDCLACQGLDGGRPLWYDFGVTQGGFFGQPPVANPDPISSLRYAYIRTSTATLGCGGANSQPRIRFYDLETGVTATHELGLQPGYGDVTVSPGGEFMMIQHDLTSNPTDSDVDVLRLCNLAAISEVQGQPPTIDNMSIVGINAHVAASSGGRAILEVRDGTGAVRWDASAACCSSGAPIGACCTGTTCSITTQAACGGVWSAGQTCSQVGCGATPPAVDALINAPATMAVNASAPMSVVVTNSGGTAASNVRVTLQSPSYQVISFASPGQGGVLGFQPGNVTWTLPTLAAGASTTLTVQMNTTCWTGPQTLTTTTSATGLAQRMFTQSVNVLAPATGPVTVTATSVPNAALPLKAYDTVTHTIVLTNTAAFSQTATMSFQAGFYANFDRIDSCGGGTCQISGSTFSWSGTLAAQQTMTFVLTTRMIECFNPSFRRTGLANGGFIEVMGSCNYVLGQTMGGQQMFDVAPPVYATLEAINVQPGIIGTAEKSAAPAAGPTTQIFRGNPPLQMRATIHNTLSRTLDLGDVSIYLPSAWTITSEPTGGAVFDENSGQILFSNASIAAGGNVSFEFDATCSDLGQFGSLSINRQSPVCYADIGGFEALVLPQIPAGPYVMALNNFYGTGLCMLERGVDGRLRPVFGAVSTWSGLAQGANGDLWLIGLNLTRFNFKTLEIETYPQVAACAAGQLRDGAFQPSTGDLILYAEEANAATGVLVRFSPSSGVCNVIATDIPASIRQGNASEVLVESSGDILVSNHDVLLRFASGATGPLPPNSGQAVTIPGPTYAIANSGPQTAQHVWSIVPLCTGLWSVVHATDFMTPAVGSPSRVFGLSLWDPAANQLTPVDPLFAGESYSPFGGWSISQSLLPTFGVTNTYPVEVSTASMIEGEPGEVLFGTALYPTFEVTALDPATGALNFLQSPMQWQFTAALDVAYFQPASTMCPSGAFCAADFNQDGGVDGSDVGAFFLAWEAGDSLADVNMDGGVDGADVGAFFDLWQAGGC